ncbi:MAG: hypothetical protein ACKVX7_19025 [Planctomycetota bacterium]
MHSRRVLKGATYLITRRTALRQCFLKQRDLPIVEQAIRFCLAHAASKYGVQLHAFEFLWTHYHLVATDPLGKISLFELWLNRHTALITKILRGIDENVYAVGPFSGVSSRLVSTPGLWPGVVSWPQDLNRIQVIARPEIYFSKRTRNVPEFAELVLTKPPVFAAKSDEEFISMRQARLAEGERDLHAQFAAQGLKFMGLRNVLRMKHTDRATSIERFRALDPHLAGKDKSVRIARIRSLQAFRRQHREALIAFATDRTIEFPSGTYRMRVLLAVNVRFPEWCADPMRPPPLPS